MDFDLETAASIFILGLIISFTAFLVIGDAGFIGTAILYLAAVISGINIKNNNLS